MLISTEFHLPLLAANDWTLFLAKE